MEFYVGVTENRWFEFLSHQHFSEVNFWRPTSTRFQAILPGSPFLLKLHKPHNVIAGVGFFGGFSQVNLGMAWDCFGQANGYQDFQHFAESALRMKRRIRPQDAPHGLGAEDLEIGNIILFDPVFFAESDWISVDDFWQDCIVQGKKYSTQDPLGLKIWKQVSDRLQGRQAEPPVGAVYDLGIGYSTGVEFIESGRQVRLGQGGFRAILLDAYQSHCCITGETTGPVLEAAHIMPVASQGRHEVSNGLVLRSDFHVLFDRGFIGIDPDYRIHISDRIRERYNNGKRYYDLANSELRFIPEHPHKKPSRENLEWHMKNIFDKA